MQIIDLTHTVGSDMMVYPGDPQVKIAPALEHDSDYCHVDRLCLGSHTGTHIDAPYHFLPQGKRITDFPASYFVGEGIAADLQQKQAGAAIRPEDLQGYGDRLRAGDFLILQTGWCEKFGTEDYLDHPYISAEAASWMVEQGIRIVAVDFLNVDPTLYEQWEAHPVLLGNDTLIVENLANSLALEAGRRYQFMFAPLKLQGSDGSPIRALAQEI